MFGLIDMAHDRLIEERGNAEEINDWLVACGLDETLRPRFSFPEDYQGDYPDWDEEVLWRNYSDLPKKEVVSRGGYNHSEIDNDIPF